MNKKDITIGVLILIIIGGATGLGIISYIVYKIYLWFINYNPFEPITNTVNDIISDTTKTVSKVGSGTKKTTKKISSGTKSTTSKVKKKIGL